MTTLTLQQIQQLYPNEWILIGNPELRKDDFAGSMIQKIIAGIVLYHSKDKRELGYKVAEVSKNISETACIYTGEIPKNRKFWL
jgi:hypothetical protein